MVACFCVPFLLSLCAYSVDMKKPLMVPLVHALVSSKQIPQKNSRIYLFLYVIKLTSRSVARKQRQNLDQNKSATGVDPVLFLFIEMNFRAIPFFILLGRLHDAWT